MAGPWVKYKGTWVDYKGPWVKYKEGSAVQEAIAVVKALEMQGRRITYMHQGAEESVPAGALGRLREVTVNFSGSYPKAPGGQRAQRETAADFLRKFLGYGFADASNTFIHFQQGRSGLGKAFHMAAEPYIRTGLKPAMAVGHLSWPMVASLARSEYIATHIEYRLDRQGLDPALTASLGETAVHDREQPLLALLYTNYPNNPTGLHGESGDTWKAQFAFNNLNTERKSLGLPPIVHVADNPYFMSCDRLPGEKHALKSAYRGVFERHGPTPTIVDTSLAKALALATPGVHLLSFTSDGMAAQYERESKATTGLSYFPEAMAAVAAMLHPDRYDDLSAHFAVIAAKYERNFGIVQASPLGAHLLDGDAGMVCTIRVPDSALNRLVECRDGAKREIRTGRQVAEYIANGKDVMVVDQSTGKEALLRLALKAEDQGVIQQGVDGIAAAYEELQSAPALEPAQA